MLGIYMAKKSKTDTAATPTPPIPGGAPIRLAKTGIMGKIDDVVQNLNTSKAFAGLMIIILNIGSRFVTIKLSKSMEAYLKYTFSKQILIFAIAWMGTRDIYIALIVTTIFTICMEYLFNEESRFCCLPENFTNYHIELLDKDPEKQKDATGAGVIKPTNQITDKDIENAKAVLEKAGLIKPQASTFGDYSAFVPQ